MTPTVTCTPWKPVSVEARREQALRETQTLAVERGELVHLTAHERGAQQCGDGEPQVGVALVLASRRADGQHHGERAHEQYEAADRGEGDVVDLVGAEPARVTPSIEHVGGDETTEQQALAAQEHPHGQLVVAEAGGRGVLGVSIVVVVTLVVVVTGVARFGLVNCDISQGSPTPSWRHRYRRAGRNRCRRPLTVRATNRTSPSPPRGHRPLR